MIRIVSLDLYLMRHWATFVDGVKSVLGSAGVIAERERYDVRLVDAFAKASYRELDYEAEARSQVRFRAELAPRLAGDVYVPEVFPVGTRRKVLTTEWVDGEQLAKSPPAVIQRLTAVGVRCFLMQLLETGYFHSDPHPGNLLVNGAGQLVLIDFGLCAGVSGPDTGLLTQTIVHLMEGDVPAMVEDAVGLGFLPHDVDRAALTPVLRSIFEDAQLARREGGASATYRTTAARRVQFRAVSRQLNQVFFDFPFQVPEYFALITRALIVLEGIAVTGDPAFDLFAAAFPYARTRALQLFGARDMAKIHNAVPRPESGGADRRPPGEEGQRGWARRVWHWATAWGRSPRVPLGAQA